MRWLRFNIVGVMGAVIQFTLLAFLGRVVSMHYLLATVLSVEAAVLHNFIWHWRWTWRDRRGAVGQAIAALARFNLTNGLVSITANLLSAFLLTGACQIDPIIASLVSTAVGSVANFLLADRLVFRSLVGRGSPRGWAKSTAKAAPASETSLPPATCSEGKRRHNRTKLVDAASVALRKRDALTTEKVPGVAP